MVEHATVNRRVAGSSPAPGAFNPKAVGERSEAMILAALLRSGYNPLLPAFTDNKRYDFVLDMEDGRFLRVQAKTGRLKRDGAVVAFPTASCQTHRGHGRQDYRGQADYFAVYCPELDRIYWVPVDDTASTECWLRLRDTENGQSARIRQASDYEQAPR